NLVYNYGAALLRAMGDTRRPFYYLLLAGIVNVILNLIMVIVFHLGVAGVALATVIAQIISAVLVLRCLMAEKGPLRLYWRRLGFDRESLRQIIWVGLPAGCQGIIFGISNVVIQSAVNSFGETVIAGNSAASNLEGFIYLAMVAFYQVAISFSSQNFGARNYQRVFSTFLLAEMCVIIIGLSMGFAMWLNSQSLLGLYSNSATVIAAGMVRIKVICCPYCLCGMMDVASGALRGIGYSLTPMLVSLVGACGLRLLWLATIFQQAEYHNITTVYLSYPISWAATLAVLLLCFAFVLRKHLHKPALTPAIG
ncbi:MAG: MATE family efflux transporter, partial [Oligosphaeraceae bacterium]|nr:MATE family efflux transporter [Oligosphaeraceae bacterium]